MSDLDDLTRLPEDFDGRVRLFPLPSMVLFPHAMQPLHIFEPRYCEMLAEALETDQLIAMATLGLEESAELSVSGFSVADPKSTNGPAVAKTVCVGKIVSHVELENERHNLLLVGIKRARITSEIDAGRCFRIAQIDVLDDLYPPSGSGDRSQLRSELVAAFGKVIPATDSVEKGLAELMTGTMGLGPITDIIAHTLPLSVTQKIELLDQADVDARARRLIEFLSKSGVELGVIDPEQPSDENTGRLPFPPGFSLN